VSSGKASLNAESDIATLPKEGQKEIVTKGEEEILQAAKEIRSSSNTDAIHADDRGSMTSHQTHKIIISTWLWYFQFRNLGLFFLVDPLQWMSDFRSHSL